MSAIAGVLYRDDRPVAEVELQRMAEALAHRGPDGSAVQVYRPVGLVHRMLWTTPESRHEELPRLDAEEDLFLTADARLDNRDELIVALGLGGQPRENIPDTEIILRAYQRWGEDCPTHLLGDFAFALWDGREQKLVCARDPMGVKPLYYYSGREVFAFATEIKALLALPDMPCRLNEERVAEFLVPTFDDRTATFYQEIFRLPAAHVLIAGIDMSRMRRYWAPDSSRVVRCSSDEEYVEGFRALFREAIRTRLRSAYPVGSTLSGGLDSSSITCTAVQILSEQRDFNLHTFSAVFPDLPDADLRLIDEREYIEAVVALGSFRPHYVRGDRLSPLQDVDTVLWHADEPFVAPNLYLHWALYGAAQRQGARIFLDGIDGDTTVSHGLGYLAELAGTGRWRSLVREATVLAATSGLSSSPRRIVWEYGILPSIPSGPSRLWHNMRDRFGRNPHFGDLVNPAFAQRVGLAGRLRGAEESNRSRARAEREIHRRGLMSPIVPYVLELADKAAAAFELEPRYPFFDRRLIEYCLGLPADQKLRAGWTRSIMRRAMEGILPPKVQWRAQKANLSPNFTRQLFDRERETLDRVIYRKLNAIDAYVDMQSLRAAYQRYTSDATRTPHDAAGIHRAVMLALWLEQTGIHP